MSNIYNESISFHPQKDDGSCHIFAPTKLQIHAPRVQFLNTVDLGPRTQFTEIDDHSGNKMIETDATKTLTCASDLTFDFNSCTNKNVVVEQFTSNDTTNTFATASIQPTAIATCNPSAGYAHLDAEIDALTVSTNNALTRTQGFTTNRILRSNGAGLIEESTFDTDKVVRNDLTTQQNVNSDINLSSGKRIKYDGVNIEISSADKLDKDFGNIPNDAILPEANIHSSITRDTEVNTATTTQLNLKLNKNLDNIDGVVPEANIHASITRDTEVNTATTTQLNTKLNTDLSNIGSSVVPEANIHADITRDSEVNTATTTQLNLKLNKNLDNIDGVVPEANIHADITRDSEVNTATTTQLNLKLNKNLDNIDGVVPEANIHASITRDTEVNTATTTQLNLKLNKNLDNIDGVVQLANIHADITRDSEVNTATTSALSGKMATDFSNATGTIADARIPTNITRDDEVGSAVNTQLNLKLNKNLDNINGVVPEANIHSSIARLAGPTFTGTIKLPTSLSATGQFLRVNGSTGAIEKATPTDTNTQYDNTDFVDLTSTQTVAGEKTFSNDFNLNGDLHLAEGKKIFFGSSPTPAIEEFGDGIFFRLPANGFSYARYSFITLQRNTSNVITQLESVTIRGGDTSSNFNDMNINNAMRLKINGGDLIQYDVAGTTEKMRISGGDITLPNLTASKFVKTDANKKLITGDIALADVSTLVSTLNTIDTRLSETEDGTWTAIGTSGGNISTGSGYQSKFALEPLQYMKRGNQIFLRGVIGVTSTGSIANNTVILEINNSGYYPTRSQSYPVACHDSNGVGSAIQGIVTVNASGTNDNKIVFYDDTSDASFAGTIDIHGFYWTN